MYTYCTSFKHSLAFLTGFHKEGLYTKQLLQQKHFAPNCFYTKPCTPHTFYTKGFSLQHRMTVPLSCLYLHQCCFVSLQLACFMRKDSLTSPSRNKRASCKLFHVFLTRAPRTLAICDVSAIFCPKASVFCSVVLRPLKKALVFAVFLKRIRP